MLNVKQIGAIMEKRIGYKINHLSYNLKREVNKLPAIVKLENIVQK